MKLLLRILIGLAVLLLIVFFVGAMALPDRVRVERTTRIDRPPGMVFAVANDLRRFNDWSPWAGHDPDAEYRFEGPARGAGAQMHWTGNASVGTGSIRIVESEAPARVVTEVSFEGFDAPARAELRIAPEDADASSVTWTFDAALEGASARWFGLLMPRHLGEDYERGLAALKREVESLPAPDSHASTVTETTLMPLDVIVIAGSAPAGDMAAVAAALGESYGRLVAYAMEHGLEITGSPMTLTAELPGDVWQFEAALPVRASGPVESSAAIELRRIAGGPALAMEYVGPYDGLADARARLAAHAQAYGHQRAGAMQDIYVSDPADTPADELVTRIVHPIAGEPLP